MPRVFGYLRVSTVDQADSGVGLAAQRKNVEREFDLRWKEEGYGWGGWFEDAAVSGSKPLLSRRQGQQLDAAAERGDVILFPKLDRGFRNTKDAITTAEAWLSRGVRPVFLDIQADLGSAVGRLILTVMAGVAEFERARIGERSKDVIAVARARGRQIGRPPFGLRMVGPKGHKRLAVDYDEFQVGKKVVEYRMAGHPWEHIYYHFRAHKVGRKVTPAQRRRGAKGEREWSITGLKRAYVGTIRILRLIDKGKVEEPKAPNR